MPGFCAIAILAFSLLLTQASFAGDAGVRSRESFNASWRFARFGPLAGRSIRPEPGAERWSIVASASSEEASRGNVAENAFDGDQETRWCASSGGTDEWLVLDLGRDRKIGRIVVGWEFPDLTYGSAIEVSPDGKVWTPFAPGAARLVRIRATKLPDAKWASIREVKLFDPDGQAIGNERVAGTRSPSAVEFDDSAWRTLDIPHDWGIEGPFRDDLPGDTGKLPWKGIGWYRKHFTVPVGDQGKRIFIDFDGAMANAKVWLNGQYVGTWPYGYQAFRLELTPHVNFGFENVLAVRLDTARWGSRWYPGAGLYRNVWIVKTSPVHVAHWGVYVTTPSITNEKGIARIVVAVDNQSRENVSVSVQTEVLELAPDGSAGARAAATPRLDFDVGAGASGAVNSTAAVPNPRRWDLATPNRYLARTTIRQGEQIVDSHDQPFGFRTIEFTPRDGFMLNGRRVPLYGTCNHHDLGPLGAALNLRALERQLEILKEMGGNALRTSHNPPAPELLDLADQMGFVVMVEAFDCWKQGKTGGDYSRLFDEWHAKDLQAMVQRERNHPSVIMWSIGNEIAEQDGPELAQHLRDIVHAEDPTRPVTAGCNKPSAGTNGFQTAVDVFGLNYHTRVYRRILDHPGNERKPVYTSESSSCISSRGEYFFPIRRGKSSEANFQVSSYDVDAPPWAQPPDEVFEALDRNPAFFGEFVWTGFDYLGEPTPYNNDVTNLLNFSDPEKRAEMKKQLDALGKLKVPSASSYFGIVDLCGFKKDRFYIYQARWRSDLPMVHILPHWNWPERVGQTTPVHVYTSGDEADLFLNGKSLGRKKKGPYEYRLRWNDVAYQPGTLEVVAYRDGKEWAHETVKTTGEPARVLLSVDRSEIRADGLDLAFVAVVVSDQEGAPVPRSHNLVQFEIEGPGEIVAVGNGDAASHEPFQAKERSAYNGLCQVIVKGRSGRPGPITVKATSNGLKDAAITFPSK
ncbi:MAG: beta-galactosidase GalB [Isosphaeraceae bacterium]